LGEFEKLFTSGPVADRKRAVYPPTAKKKRGPLQFRCAHDGGLVVEVEPCGVEAEDFRLRMLFNAGLFVFPDAGTLACFWNGPLAEAFGVPPGPFPDDPIADAYASVSEDITEPRRAPIADRLAAHLARRVHGQQSALRTLAEAVSTQLAKRRPQRPATVLLLGPTGVGKTVTLQALPEALKASGLEVGEPYWINCNELVSSYDAHRFLGTTPGLVGYDSRPALVSALGHDRPIVVLDEIDKAHPRVLEVLYTLLDTGRVMTPDGAQAAAPGAIILLTSACGADELEARLHQIPYENRQAVELAAIEHLREQDWPDELLGRLEAVAVFGALDDDSRREAAASAIRLLADEYGFHVAKVDDVLVEVVLDLSRRSSGARGLYHAARRLLGECLASAAADGSDRRIALDAGPPPTVRLLA